MDAREIVQIDAPYYEINREERFFCATLYALLICNNNLAKFVHYLNQQYLKNTGEAVDENDFDNMELYVEYAYLRDIWNSIGPDNNEKKRDLILKSLGLSNHSLDSLDVHGLNQVFVGRGEPSITYIQNPGTWSISKYSKSGFFPNPEGNVDFEKVCKFKWCFNIKPDIVIQIGKKRVISIEAKLESGEGCYPSNEKEIEEFKRRSLKLIKQTELQKFMFEQLLGIKASLFYLTKNKSKTEEVGCFQITWDEIFTKLDFEGFHPFVRKALNKNLYLNPKS